MTGSNTKSTVLVTGGSGFVGAHCLVQLLQQGCKVRTTRRSMSKKNEVLEMLRVGGIALPGNITFIETDLTKDLNWDKAMDVASRRPSAPPLLFKHNIYNSDGRLIHTNFPLGVVNNQKISNISFEI